MRRGPVSARMRRAFEAAGCVFRTTWHEPAAAQEVPEGTLGAFSMHPVTGPDGGYVGDAGRAGGHHFRWLARHGIFAPLCLPRGGQTCAIGRATRGHHAGSWVGWSHRASCAFSVGSTVKPGDCAFVPSNRQEQEQEFCNFWREDGDGVRTNFTITADDDGLRAEWTAGGTRRSQSEPWLATWGRGAWTAETDEDAKQMAIDFAENVS